MDAHDLYGLPLERFVPERTALARELRKAGERDQAEAVGALRKPSVAAWAVNQLVRTQSRALTELFDAGDAVQSVQANLIAGRGERHALRQALDRERHAVTKLVGVARGLLTSDGNELSPSTLDRVSETLDAAALEDEARTQIRQGCLHRELRRVGMGAGPVVDTPPAPKARKSKHETPKLPARTSRANPDTPEPKAPATKPKTRAPRRDADLRALRKDEAEARRAAERAGRKLESARSQRDAAARALETAEKAVILAAERARAANAAHRKAERQLRSHR